MVSGLRPLGALDDEGSRVGVWDLGFRAWDFAGWDSGVGIRGLGFGVWGVGHLRALNDEDVGILVDIHVHVERILDRVANLSIAFRV